MDPCAPLLEKFKASLQMKGSLQNCQERQKGQPWGGPCPVQKPPTLVCLEQPGLLGTVLGGTN